jgi:hypothetical protein
MNIWTILGIRATANERDIKRAYANQLKTTRPEDDPQGFQDLREAYETALRMARYAGEVDVEEEQEPETETEPVYTAFYEWDPDTGPEVPVYRAVFDFVPDHDQSAASAVVEARRIWADFLPRAHINTRQQLAELAQRSDFLDLEVRECFELCAVQYCAGEGCDDQFRVDLAEHFLWERNASFIHREMPDETEVMLARLEAYRSYLRRRP